MSVIAVTVIVKPLLDRATAHPEEPHNGASKDSTPAKAGTQAAKRGRKKVGVVREDQPDLIGAKQETIRLVVAFHGAEIQQAYLASSLRPLGQDAEMTAWMKTEVACCCVRIELYC